MPTPSIDLDTLLHPPLPPARQWHLPVAGGHRLYVEECGHPDGVPVVCLHGGPGSGSTPLMRRFFDPARFRIILTDQRGAGRSEPAGCLRDNDTPALVADLETLRRQLDIERWLVFGGSWGATLALVYAQAHSSRVLGLVLRGPLLGRRRDLDWFFGPEGVSRIYPHEYRAFLSALPETRRTTPLTGYYALLQSPDPADRERAAHAWAAWEQRVTTGQAPEDSTQADSHRAAIACHYAVHGFFLPETGVLAGMHRLRDTPGVVVQGQRDLVCPAEGAVTLAEHWPAARLQLVAQAGHLAGEPDIARALRAGVDALAQHIPAPRRLPHEAAGQR